MNKSFYFQHDYNASSDAKILFLRQQLGMEGYGIFWFVLEQLAQAGGSLPLKIIPVLAMQSQTQETKVNAVIHGYELFVIDGEIFYSNRLNDHFEIRRYLSDQGKRGAERRWKNGVAIGGANSGAIGHPNGHPNGGAYAKERIGDEKKGEERIGEETQPGFWENEAERKRPLSECLGISIKDDGWVRKNKTNIAELQTFNDYLEKIGETEKTLNDYKKHFANLKMKSPEKVKNQSSSLLNTIHAIKGQNPAA